MAPADDTDARNALKVRQVLPVSPPGSYPPRTGHLVTFREVTAVPLAPEPVVGLLKTFNAGRRP